MLAKFVGVAEKLGKNFEDIMDGVVMYPLQTVLGDLTSDLARYVDFCVRWERYFYIPRLSTNSHGYAG
jgi:hypothetical protein